MRKLLVFAAMGLVFGCAGTDEISQFPDVAEGPYLTFCGLEVSKPQEVEVYGGECPTAFEIYEAGQLVAEVEFHGHLRTVRVNTPGGPKTNSEKMLAGTVTHADGKKSSFRLDGTNGEGSIDVANGESVSVEFRHPSGELAGEHAEASFTWNEAPVGRAMFTAVPSVNVQVVNDPLEIRTATAAVAAAFVIDTYAK
jgi:hypothetical protein